MSQRNHKETNDFSQKMHHQGKAGFGAGPWSDPARIGVKARPSAPSPGTDRGRPGALPARPDKHPPCRLGDRILTGLAILSLGMLIVGAMGAYLSNDSQRVATTTRSGDVTPAAFPAASDARYLELESRLAQINDLYGQRLHALETKVEQTVDPYEARLTTIEHRLEAAASPAPGGMRDSGIAQAPFDARAYEARLAALENRLEQAYAPYQAALRDMENRVGQGYASYDARLREMESRLMQLQMPHEQRIQALEQQLIYASARLDYLSAEMESLSDNNAALIEASATLQNDPPAALPAKRSESPWSPPATNGAAPADTADAQTTQPAVAPVETIHEAAIVPAVTPADAAAIAAPAPVAPSQDTVATAAPEISGEVVSETAQAGDRATETTAAPETVAAPAPPPSAIAPAEPVQTPATPVEAAARMIDRNSTPAPAGSGGWIINLASYASESIAARKLADFKRKGVGAEQSVATVNGKTIYRVCIAGFDTRKAAVEQAETIRQQLGLKETWITRR